MPKGSTALFPQERQDCRDPGHLKERGTTKSQPILSWGLLVTCLRLPECDLGLARGLLVVCWDVPCWVLDGNRWTWKAEGSEWRTGWIGGSRVLSPSSWAYGALMQGHLSSLLVLEEQQSFHWEFGFRSATLGAFVLWWCLWSQVCSPGRGIYVPLNGGHELPTSQGTWKQTNMEGNCLMGQFSLGGDENVLELDRGGDYTISWTYSMSPNCSL